MVAGSICSSCVGDSGSSRVGDFSFRGPGSSGRSRDAVLDRDDDLDLMLFGDFAATERVEVCVLVGTEPSPIPMGLRNNLGGEDG